MVIIVAFNFNIKVISILNWQVLKCSDRVNVVIIKMFKQAITSILETNLSSLWKEIESLDKYCQYKEEPTEIVRNE